MDEIDINLLDAWWWVRKRVLADPEEARKRAARRHRVTVRAPLRQWCLCLRASDTRIHGANCMVHPAPPPETLPEPWASEVGHSVLEPDEPAYALIERQRMHQLTLPGETIRKLMKPVYVPRPGIDWKLFAARCGVTKHYLRQWMRNGQVRVDHYRNAYSLGQRGRAVPMVFTPKAIDPNAFDSRPPDAMWGSLWTGLWQRLPEQFHQTVTRVPRWRMLRGRRVFRGWTWVCPGRIGPDGGYLGCGRTCNRLFGPLAAWTLPEAIDDRLDLAGWSPGFDKTGDGQTNGGRSFACKQCWGVRDASLVGGDGWNTFVTHVSGGLLYGHEVDRPVELAPQVRKRRKTKRRESKVESRKSKGGKLRAER